MKSFFAVSVLLVMATIAAFAQPVLKKGYVIENSNDTIYGFIEFKGNKTNANVCVFRQDAKSEPLSFAPGDIKGYWFEGSKYYISKTVTVNNQEKLLFLEFLINGIVDMYYCFDGLADNFFVDAGDNRLLELKKSQATEYYATYTKRAIPNSKQYIGILKYVFKDSPEISKRVETIGLSRRSLIDVAYAYHKEVCADEAIIYAKRESDQTYIKTGVLSGVGFVTLLLFLTAALN
ncbi:MAG: hypothetical protein R6X09_05185 [Bacteroidales bacterium]